MNILLISQFYPPIIGGEERHVRNLAAALVRRGHRVDVATLWIPGASEFETDGSVRIHRIRGTLQRIPGLFTENQRRFAPPFPDPELVAGLNRIVNQVKPNVVHAHNWILASFLPVKLWNRVRLVVTLHDYSLVCAKKVYLKGGKVCDGPALRKCFSCARDYYGGAAKAGVTTVANYGTGFLAHQFVDKFIAVSHAVARFNRLTEAGVAFEVIPNFVPDDIDVPSPEVDPCVEQLPEQFIMFAGDLAGIKGIDVLLRAYAGLNAAPPLVLIGRRTAETPSEFPPNVYQFESWPHQAVMHAWRRCLFAVVPSTVPDACPTVVMEAMASGKAVIGSDVGGIPDLIEHEKTGYLVPVGDPVKLGSAIQSLLTNPAMRERLQTAGLARVASLKASPVVSRIEQVYAA
jgi:glycosyltransferase involved in cell wall biosynthesis